MDILLNDGNIIKNIKTIVWDKDGTIIDSNCYWGEIIKRRSKKIIDTYNVNKDYLDKICALMGFDLKTQKLMEKGPIALLSRDEVLEILHEGLLGMGIDSGKTTNNQIFNDVHEEFKDEAIDYVQILPYVEDTIKLFFKNDINQILITSDTKENAITCLKKFNLDKYFNKIYGKNDFSAPKKTGMPLIEALKQNNLNKDEVICIGDAKMDYDMAQNASVKAALLVATGQISIKELQKYSKYSINNLSEIKCI